MRAPDRHHRGRGGDEDPRQVPARARERGVGPAAGAHVRQDVPAHLRRVPRARRAAARRGVPPALRAAGDEGADAVRPGRGGRRRRRRAAAALGPVLVTACSWPCSARSSLLGTLGRTTRRRRPPASAGHARRRTRRRRRRSAANARRAGAPAARALRIAPRGPSRLPRRRRRQGSINQQTMQAGQRTQTFRGRRFRSLRQRPGADAVDGEVVRCRPRRRDRLRPAAGPRAAPAVGRRSGRPARERPRRHRRHGHRGALGDHPRPQRPVAVRAAARARRRSRARSSSATARTTCARALDFLAGQGVDLIVTSGGLGPTADDLTAEVVAAFAGPPLALDEALEERIWAILAPLRGAGATSTRTRSAPARASRRSCRGRDRARAGRHRARPGRPAGDAARRSCVLPGPPRELQPMWAAALATDAAARGARARGHVEQRILRLFGLPESEIAALLRELRPRELDRAGDHDLPAAGRARDRDALRAGGGGAYARSRRPCGAPRRHAVLRDGSTIDEIVAALLLGPPVRTIAVAESCTGGLMAAPPDRPPRAPRRTCSAASSCTRTRRRWRRPASTRR